MNHPKKALVFVADDNVADFVNNHFLPSLDKHVEPDVYSAVLIAYGWEPDTSRWPWLHIEHRPRPRGQAIVNSRLRDVVQTCGALDVEIVGMIDCADVIFQGPMSGAFDLAGNRPAGVLEDTTYGPGVFEESVAALGPARWAELTDGWSHEPMINGGFLIAPIDTFTRLADLLNNSFGDCLHAFGLDQIVMNAFFRGEGFVALPPMFNFLPGRVNREFTVVDGEFLERDGSPIHMVHNAGGKEGYRVIEDFGFGPEHNHVRNNMLRLLTSALRKA